MGGDGGGLLTLAVIAIAAAVVVAAATAGGWSSGRLFRRRDERTRRRAIGIGGTAGAIAGLMLVAWAFLPQLWRPAPVIDLVPAEGGTVPDLVILLEDARAPIALPAAPALPFRRWHARLPVPAGGVVRVRSFAPFKAGSSGVPELRWPDGPGRGMSGGNRPPPSTAATGYLAAWRVPPERWEDDPTNDDARFAAHVRRAEGAGR